MPRSFGRAIDHAIEDFRQQLAEARERELAEMQKTIADLQEVNAELSREIAQIRLDARQRDLLRGTGGLQCIPPHAPSAYRR